jgi:hypothetical protein
MYFKWVEQPGTSFTAYLGSTADLPGKRKLGKCLNAEAKASEFYNTAPIFSSCGCRHTLMAQVAKEFFRAGAKQIIIS